MVQERSFWIALLVGVPLYWRLPGRLRAGFLALLSAGVLALSAPGVVAALAFGTTALYLVVRAKRPRGHAAILLAVLTPLLVFKYLPPVLPGLYGGLLVPLGLSFVTFKLLHYAIESGRGNFASHRLVDVLAWVFLFPSFTAGPIERFDHFQKETRESWSRDETVEGLTRIVVGLIKRFVLAELVFGELYKSSDPAEFVAQIDGFSSLQIWGWLSRSFVRLYFDFSGYTDIALGAALLFGRRLVENFDSPLLASSPANFWQRWHISLARWCSTYVYMPALGLTRQPYVAVFATFLVMGLWHAGSVHWVMWGVWQGAGVAGSMYLARRAKRGRWTWAAEEPVPLLATLGTFLWMAAAQSFSAFHGVAELSTSFDILGRLLFLPV